MNSSREILHQVRFEDSAEGNKLVGDKNCRVGFHDLKTLIQKTEKMKVEVKRRLDDLVEEFQQENGIPDFRSSSSPSQPWRFAISVRYSTQDYLVFYCNEHMLYAHKN